MHFIKLDAIGSTNDYLKELSASGKAENHTVVTAKTQFAGRGQMGAKWESESGKNLIMSVLFKEILQNPALIYSLNIAVAVSISDVLKTQNIPEISIKWPNDILSGNKKLGGILIENIFKPSGGIDSVIGIGLNVNQTDFSHLPKASSLLNVSGSEYDVDELAFEIAVKLVENLSKLNEEGERFISGYKNLLFKKDIPTAFEIPDSERFMGIIRDVSEHGKLVVEVENGDFKEFGLKEIQMLY